FQKRQAVLALDPYSRLARIEHAPAAHGNHRRILPNNESVTGEKQHWPVKLQARESGLAGQKLLAAEQRHLRDRLGSESVQMHACVLPQRLRRSEEHTSELQ